VDAWGQRGALSTDDRSPVGKLLKVLGITGSEVPPTVHRSGEKVGGLPVDNRWTTVDNPVHTDHLWIASPVIPRVLHS
jgi:hypothetical protein